LLVFRSHYKGTKHDYGQGTGEIFIDDLECLGTENDVSECKANEWHIHDCAHREDVVIKCGNT